MPSKLGRVSGVTVGLLLLGIALMRGLFDAYGYVGQFLGILPEGWSKFIASANGTVLLIVVGLFFSLVGPARAGHVQRRRRAVARRE